VEEDGFGLEIRQRDNISHVEFPLTRWHSSKQGNQARNVTSQIFSKFWNKKQMKLNDLFVLIENL
jgi:hypothetical protein